MRKKRIQRVIKRVFDIVISFIGMFLLAIPFAIIALGIKLDSIGPIIFRQDRAGKRGIPFTLYKFRTMVGNAPDGFVKENDPRITWVGQFLRLLTLDEIPQLWNILKGDMSLVGPRPDRVFRAKEYSERIRQRLSIDPGIMGLAQLYDGRKLAWSQRYEYDLEYVDNWSLWFDVKIVVLSVVRGKMIQNEGETRDEEV